MDPDKNILDWIIYYFFRFFPCMNINLGEFIFFWTFFLKLQILKYINYLCTFGDQSNYIFNLKFSYQDPLAPYFFSDIQPPKTKYQCTKNLFAVKDFSSLFRWIHFTLSKKQQQKGSLSIINQKHNFLSKSYDDILYFKKCMYKAYYRQN